MTIDDLYLEVVRILEKRADIQIASKKIYYHKKSGYRSYGIRTPVLRELIKSHKSRLKRLSLEGRFALAKLFYKSGFSEQATYGNTILEINVGSMTPKHFDFLDEIISYFNSWATTDWFCILILQPLLRKYTKETLDLLRKWNRSENIWKRRASVVAFVRKIGESGEFTDEVLELCENLIWDKEDLVLKGVGWVLKDNMRGAKERVLDYVKTLRRKGVPSIITLYAIRDLISKEREGILKIKPLHR